MPKSPLIAGDVQPGDVFEDCRHHPCYCYDIGEDGEAVFGISLIDGSTWQCAVRACGVRLLSSAEVWRWKSAGPEDVELDPEDRWW